MYPDQGTFRPEWVLDVIYFLSTHLPVQIISLLILLPATQASHFLTSPALQAVVAGMPWLVQFVLVILVADLAEYATHRALHTFPFLWRFHAVHHSAQTMDWLAGGRMHILEVFALRGFTAVPMLSFGFDPAAVQTYVLALFFFSAFVHSNVGWNLDAIEKFFVSAPSLMSYSIICANLSS